MDVKERKMELTRDIYQLIKKFHDETEVYITDLNYSLYDVTPAGGKREYTMDMYLEVKL